MGATKKVSPERKAASRAKSNANLKNGVKTQFKSGDPAAKIAGSKGGTKAWKNEREKRTARQMLEEIMSYKPVLTPILKDGLIKMGADPEEGTYTAGFLGFVALQQKAMKGDTKALQMWLEITGQDPKVILEQQRLEAEKEALKQGVRGYSALDDAFAMLGKDGSDAE